MAEAKAFILKSLNYQDIFNEIFVSLSLYWKFVYSGVITNKEVEQFYAKMEIIFILFYCFVNLIVIVYSIYDKNKKYARRAYYQINHKYE